MLTDIDLSFTVQPDDELIVTDIEEGIERFESLTDERVPWKRHSTVLSANSVEHPLSTGSIAVSASTEHSSYYSLYSTMRWAAAIET